MKRILSILAAVMMLLGMLLPEMALGVCRCDDGKHDWGPWSKLYSYADNYGEDFNDTSVWATYRSRVCSICGMIEKEFFDYDGNLLVRDAIWNMDIHEWSDWKVTKEATCSETGIKSRTCSNCGNTETETIPKTDHKWRIVEVDNDWDYEEDSVLDRGFRNGSIQVGYKYRYCPNCDTFEKIGPLDHKHTWGDWKVTKEATCKQNGTRTRTCSSCGQSQTETIPKASAHQFGDWEVSKEATCTKEGKEKCFCRICGASRTRVIEKLGHSYGEYEVIEEATDCTKGKRASTCARCGKQLTEEFYPEGTLYKGGNNPPEKVKALQTALADLGLYKGKIVGEYGNGTYNAVSKFERDYLGMKADGIAWPKVIRALGVQRTETENGNDAEWDEGPVSSDTSKVKLLLTAEQTSPRLDYEAGNTISIQWTVTNLSEKDGASSICVYQYKGMKADKKKDQEIARPEDIAPGASQSGTFEYTVTEEDEAAGKFTVGFIVRAKVRKKDESSNRVWFNFHAGSGEPEITIIEWPSEPSKPADTPDSPAGPADAPKTGDNGSGDGSWERPDDPDEPPADTDSEAVPACGKVLIAEGEGKFEYEITACETHRAAAEESARRVEAGDFDGAIRIWDDAISSLYSEWSAGADEKTQSAIVEEQAAFESQMKALDASLRLVCGEEEAGMIALRERMDKCISLCGEVHRAPRTDSITREHTVLSGGSAGDVCSRESFSLGNNSVHTVDNLCAAHLQPMKAVRQAAADAGEAPAAAWEQAQTDWLLDLNAMYDKWYLAADQSMQDTIAADRLSFDRLVEARKNTMAALYPDDPATAAEVLAAMIRERTELVCSLLHGAGIPEN